MAVPLFEIQHLVNRHKIELCSSNYAYYADMSARVMAILEEFTPQLEVYSIDEAFLDLSNVYVCQTDPIGYAKNIKYTVQQYTGIPVCVGLGPTKTLAKLANFAAKKWQKTGGVLDLSVVPRRIKLMKIVPVAEVWGIGVRTANKLNHLGIHSVWDLACQPLSKIQAQFGVVLTRTVLELNGIACQELETVVADKQQIVCSRSFRHRLNNLSALSTAIAEFACRTSEKLRAQRAVAQLVTVFIRTDPFNQTVAQYQRAASNLSYA